MYLHHLLDPQVERHVYGVIGFPIQPLKEKLPGKTHVKIYAPQDSYVPSMVLAVVQWSSHPTSNPGGCRFESHLSQHVFLSICSVYIIISRMGFLFILVFINFNKHTYILPDPPAKLIPKLILYIDLHHLLDPQVEKHVYGVIGFPIQPLKEKLPRKTHIKIYALQDSYCTVCSQHGCHGSVVVITPNQ